MEKQILLQVFLVVLKIRVFCALKEGECGETGPFKCCFNFIEKGGKCVRCPAGTYGRNCSLICPKGYYGFLCKKKCDCENDEICHSITGCSPYACPVGSFGKNCSLSCPPGHYGSLCQHKCNCKDDEICHNEMGCLHFGKNSTNGTDTSHTTETKDLSAIKATLVVSLVSLATVMVIVIIKRFNLCTAYTDILPKICSRRAPAPSSVEDDECLPGSNRQGTSHCSLATANEIYDDVYKLSDVYDVLELRSQKKY